eukprot:g70128.t1
MLHRRANQTNSTPTHRTPALVHKSPFQTRTTKARIQQPHAHSTFLHQWHVQLCSSVFTDASNCSGTTLAKHKNQEAHTTSTP